MKAIVILNYSYNIYNFPTYSHGEWVLSKPHLNPNLTYYVKHDLGCVWHKNDSACINPPPFKIFHYIWYQKFANKFFHNSIDCLEPTYIPKVHSLQNSLLGHTVVLISALQKRLFNIFSEDYRRYPAIGVTLCVCTSQIFKTHIRRLLDHVGDEVLHGSSMNQ